MARAPTKSVPSFSMIKVNESPPLPQEWHFQSCRSVFHEKDGVWSSWNGHSAMPVARWSLKSTP